MIRPNPLPDRDYLLRSFDYDMDSGLLLWKVRPSVRSRRRPGDEAGSLHHSGYVQIGIVGTLFLAHRLIWKRETGADPLAEIDHRNGVRNDNRWANLRAAVRSEQNMNRAARNPHKGVHFMPHRGKYGAQIKAFGEHRWLGSFDTPEAACRAYREAAAALHGEFVKPGVCGCL